MTTRPEGGEQNSAYGSTNPVPSASRSPEALMTTAAQGTVCRPRGSRREAGRPSRTANRLARSVVVGLLVACSGSSSSTPPPTPDVSRPRPEPPRAIEPDLIQFAPASGWYEVSSQSTVTQEFMGQRQEQALATVMYLAVSVSQDGDEFEAILTVDSVVVPDSAPEVPGLDVAELYRGAVGLELTARLDRGGRLLSLTEGDTTSMVAQQVVNSLRSFYPTLPDSGATVGTTWADTTSQTSTMRGIELVVSTYGDHVATSWTEVNGVPALEVATDARSEFTGRGSQGGQELDLQGSGVHAARSYFSLQGDYLGGTANDSTDIAVLVVASGMVVPVVQVASVVVRRLPPQ